MRLIYQLLYVTLLLAGICLPAHGYAQGSTPARITLNGYVVDSITGERLEFINLHEKGTTNGTMTNTNGAFELLVRPGGQLVISCVGYRTKTVSTGTRTRQLTILLAANDYQLSEVVIKPRREHYRRRNNPSVELARKVIEHKDDYSLSRLDYFDCQHYDRMTYSFNNFDTGVQEKWRKKFPFIDQYIDTALLSGSPILPISTEEKVITQFYRSSPRATKRRIEAHKRAGLDDMFPPDMIATMKTEVFPEIEINDNDVYIFTNKFVSPLSSSMAIAFYKFYLRDTVTFDDGKRYIDLGFAPLMPEQMGFIGHLWISTDSTYFVKRAELNIPPDINLNFVRNMRIVIEQDRLPDSTRVTLSKTFDSEMNVTSGTLGLYAHRTSAYSNFNFVATPDSARIFAQSAPTFEAKDLLTKKELARIDPATLDIEARDDAFWEVHRFGQEGQKRSHSVQAMMTQMREVPFFKYSEMVLTWLFKGYIPLGTKPYEENKFLYGPLNATASYNAFEGLRLRTGGITTARLNPYVFASGYFAYGFKDNEPKFDTRLEWSFNKKKMHANEFPIHSLRFDYEYDTHLLGEDPVTGKDNFLLSFKRNEEEKVTYIRKGSLTYTHEFWSGFSFYLKGTLQRETATHLTEFERVGDNRLLPRYDMAIGAAQLRYAPHETFIQTRTSRIAINHENPIFTLVHFAAGKGVLGSDFDYQRTEFRFEKRFWLSAFGYVDVDLKAGAIWTQSPFTLLHLPNANLGYTIQDGSFSQLNAMEFVNDRFAEWNLKYFLNGWIFNTMPLFKKLKWREVVTFRGFYGKLSEKNDPDALRADGSFRNPDLFRFPSDGTVYKMGHEPYMEVTFGIENIFRLLRVEYIRRLNYLDHKNVQENGIQVAVHLNF